MNIAEAVLPAAVALTLVAIAIIDIRTRRIPNGLVGLLCLLWLLGVSDISTAINGLIGALVLSGGVLAIALLYERFTGVEGFGGGDVKLIFALGLFIGFERGLIALLVASLIAMIVGFVLMIQKCIALGRDSRQRVGRKHWREMSLPYGPLLIIGALAALLFTDELL